MFTLLLTGVLVVRQVRGGIFIGLVAGTLVAVVVEAIWHLGSAVERPGGWSLSVPTLSGSPFALPDLSLVGAFSLDSFGRIGVLAAVMLVFTLGVRELLRRDGHLHRTVARGRASPTSGAPSRDCVRR